MNLSWRSVKCSETSSAPIIWNLFSFLSGWEESSKVLHMEMWGSHTVSTDLDLEKPLAFSSIGSQAGHWQLTPVIETSDKGIVVVLIPPWLQDFHPSLNYSVKC